MKLYKILLYSLCLVFVIYIVLSVLYNSNNSNILQNTSNIIEFSANNTHKLKTQLNLPVYYINLNKSTYRKEKIDKVIDSYNLTNIHRFEAVYGKNIVNNTYTFSNNETLKFTIPKNKLSKSELGCLLSHLHVIKKAYDDGQEIVLICEDDILLESLILQPKSLTELFKDAPSCDLLQLFDNDNYNIDYKKIKYLSGNVSYIINRKLMKKISDLYNHSTLNIVKVKSNRYEADSYVYEYLENQKSSIYSLSIMIPNFSLESTLNHNNKDSSRHSNSIIEKNMVNVKDKGYFENKWGGGLLYKIISLYVDKPIYYSKDNKVDLIVSSHFDNTIIDKIFMKKFNKNDKLITWSGESKRVKQDKHALVNLLSHKCERENDIWTPFILFNLNKETNTKIVNKQFKTMKERMYFLAYVAKNCVKEREDMFAEILKLRPDAHALGSCSNNFKPNIERNDYVKNSSMFENYRFVLCMENLNKEGYITEKIYNVFLGGAIPIYSGDNNTVLKFFNEKAFINVNNFKNFKECARYICELDKSIEKCQEIQSMSIFKDGVIPDMFEWYKEDNKFVKDTVTKMRKFKT